MLNDEKLKFLNEFFNQSKNFTYHGPRCLFKYRPFDNFAFDMLENNYVYLCPAQNLDDPTECDVSFDLKDIYDLKHDGLKGKCVEQITEQLRPYTLQENYERAKTIIQRIQNKGASVRPTDILDASFELQELVPDTDIAPFVNWIVGIPQKLEDPDIKQQIEKLFAIGYNAKKETGICSLSELNNVPEMWKNYADNYSGYCVEYDVSDYDFNSAIFPVIYQDDRNTNILEQIVYNFIGQMIFGFSNGQIDADKSQFLRLFLTKNTKWAYQKEWRIIGGAKEKLHSPKIKAVYLGKNCSEANKIKMQEIADKKGFNMFLITNGAVQ